MARSGESRPTARSTEFTSGLPVGTSPRGAALRPGGNVWFGEDEATKAIGMITPSGAISEFTDGPKLG